MVARANNKRADHEGEFVLEAATDLDAYFHSINSDGLIIRLAKNEAEIAQALSLRYQIFYEELGAPASTSISKNKQDRDEFDESADHLIIIDSNLTTHPIIGTTRILRRDTLGKAGRFYSADEFDLQPLLDFPGKLFELGRTCVHTNYRTRKAMEVMWRGISIYVLHHDIKLLFGCASFHGTDLQEHWRELGYLHQNHLAPEHLRVRASPYTDINSYDRDIGDARAIMRQLPPLLKGYLRLGCWIGDGAYIDHDFNTIDVLIILMTEKVTTRYYRHYSDAYSAQS
ncbi:MAG: GNAT family N-acyltransferase [Pseudomonadota bacterium]